MPEGPVFVTRSRLHRDLLLAEALSVNADVTRRFVDRYWESTVAPVPRSASCASRKRVELMGRR